MYTILWRENEKDKWDRLETRDEVNNLLYKLTNNPDVCEGDIWIFEPKADEYAFDYHSF